MIALITVNTFIVLLFPFFDFGGMTLIIRLHKEKTTSAPHPNQKTKKKALPSEIPTAKQFQDSISRSAEQKPLMPLQGKE